MKRLLLAAVCTLAIGVGATLAFADEPATHNSGGLGFHSSDQPIGFRWWMAGQKVGIDAGVGFHRSPLSISDDPKAKENNTDWSVNVGVPVVMKSWEMVHVIFRPGFVYEAETIKTPDGVGGFVKSSPKLWAVQAEIEAEVFLRENISLSAAHGVEYESIDPDISGVDNRNFFDTTGNNFTTVGFHVYLFGK